MRNRMLALFANSIPYIKQLRPIAQSAVGCIVMQQLDYWFDKHPDGFYKFLSPCPTPACKPGDTWTEELGVSSDEFRTAFDKIGIRYKSKTAFQAAQALGEHFIALGKDGKDYEYFYCSYTDKSSGKTFYLRNHALVDAALDGLAGTPPPIHVNGDRPVTEVGDPDSHIKVSETTAETTTRRTPIEVPRVPGSADDLDSKATRYSIEELETPELFGDSLAVKMADAYPCLDFETYYLKWWRSKFQKGGIGRRSGAKATLRQYEVSIEGYFDTCAKNPQNGSFANGNGHKPAADPRDPFAEWRPKDDDGMTEAQIRQMMNMAPDEMIMPAVPHPGPPRWKTESDV